MFKWLTTFGVFIMVPLAIWLYTISTGVLFKYHTTKVKRSTTNSCIFSDIYHDSLVRNQLF